jgi:hypothetical protein
MAELNTQQRGEMALRVLHSLGSQHQMYFYQEIRKRCMQHIGSLGLPLADRPSAAAELLSEVMAKLLGAAVLHGPEDSSHPGNEPDIEQLEPTFQTNTSPEKDERISWLIQEVGGRRALSHRFEDIRRRRWGRSRGSGYRIMQISSLAGTNNENTRDEDILASQEERDGQLEDCEDPHHDRDVRRAWEGMLTLASARYKPHEDVRKLLDLLASDAKVQAGFGLEWPVRKIAEALNVTDPDPPWTDDRIENARKRLRTWISGLKRQFNFDQTDLMAFFAKYGRVAKSPSSKGEVS